MRFPSLDDPGWKGFGERHRLFLEHHPHLEKEDADQFHLMAQVWDEQELPQTEYSSHESADAPESNWFYISERHLLTTGNTHYSIYTAIGAIDLTITFEHQEFRCRCDAKLDRPCEIFMDVLSRDTFLPLIEPVAIRSEIATYIVETQLPPLSVDSTLNSVLFQIILSDSAAQSELRPSTTTKKRLYRGRSSAERQTLVNQWRQRSPELRRPLLCPPANNYKLEAVPMQLRRAGGVADAFPPEQMLPADWFPDYDVRLHFSSPTGIWQVSRSGTLQKLLLQFWSEDGQLLGEPLIVGSRGEAVPVENPSQIALIEVDVQDDDRNA